MLATLRYMLAHEYWYWAICAACVVLFTLVLRVHVALVPLIERLASHLEDDDGRDAIVANRRLRALKTGMQFMEYASDPKSSLRAAKKAVKRINKRRQILKRTEPGTGLHHLHSRPDQRPWPTPEISYFSDVSDGGVSDGGLAENVPWPSVTETLAGVEALRHLDARSLEELARHAAVRELRRGEPVRQEGVEPAALTVVMRGEVVAWLPGAETGAAHGHGAAAAAGALRRFGAGARCSGFLELVEALIAGAPEEASAPASAAAAAPPISVAPVAPVALDSAREGAPPVPAAAEAGPGAPLPLSAATDSCVLEISAALLRQLAATHRRLAHALTEMVLTRFARLTCGALLKYLGLPRSLVPVMHLGRPQLPISARDGGKAAPLALTDDEAVDAAQQLLAQALLVPLSLLREPATAAAFSVVRLGPSERMELWRGPVQMLIPLTAPLSLHPPPSRGSPAHAYTHSRRSDGDGDSDELGEPGEQEQGGEDDVAYVRARRRRTEPAELQPGDVDGMLATLTNRPILATAVALRDHGAVAVALSAAGFRSLCRRCPQLLLQCAAKLLPGLPPLLRVLDHCARWSMVRSGDHLPREEHAVVVVLCGRLQVLAEADDDVRARGGSSGGAGFSEIPRSHESAFGDVAGGSSYMLAGDSMGEAEAFALLDGSEAPALPPPRKAARDTELLSLPASVVTRAAALHAALPHALGRRLAAQWRAQQATRSAGSPRSPPTAPHQGAGRGMAAAGSRSICLLPLGSSRELQAAMRHMCDRMEQALREMRISSRVLHPTSLHEALGVQAFAPFGELSVVSFLGSLELQHRLLLYVADPFSSEWTERCLRQADLVLLVGLAEASPALAPIEALLRDARAPAARELVLLHTVWPHRPQGTRAWLEPRAGIRSHHHVRLYMPDSAYSGGVASPPKKGARHGFDEDLGAAGRGECPTEAYPGGNYSSDVHRLARGLVGMSFGIVLGGGGARGLAHVGVLRALREEGVPVDLIGGTSQGAFVAGVWALYDDPHDAIGSLSKTRLVVRQFASRMSSVWEKLTELNLLPFTSYFSGQGFNRLLVAAFGDAEIEDTPIPFFCVTTDLTTSSGFVHRNGSMWRYVRASMTLTGYLPPICDAARDEHGNDIVHLLVDGGYVNNLPADVMARGLGGSTVIAVDVSSSSAFPSQNWGDSLTGLAWCKWTLLSLISRKSRAPVPNMAAISTQLAYVSSEWQRHDAKRADIELYLQPPVQQFGLLEFGSLAEIQTVGYQYAKAEIRRWKAALRERGDPRCVIFDLATEAAQPKPRERRASAEALACSPSPEPASA